MYLWSKSKEEDDYQNLELQKLLVAKAISLENIQESITEIACVERGQIYGE